MRFPSGEETSHAIGEWFLAQGIDDEHRRLQAILRDELVKTHECLQRSPKLWALRKSGQETHIEPRYDEFPRLDDESWPQWQERIDAIAAEHGVSANDFLSPYIDRNVEYWELSGTRLVYVNICHISAPTEDNKLKELSIDFARKSEMEEAIQGLRLLRASFN